MKKALLFEGLGAPGTSPIRDLRPYLHQEGYDVSVYHWKQVWNREIDFAQFAGFKTLVTGGHSLGGFAQLEFARQLDEELPNQIIGIYCYGFDPVPGDPDHPWRQLFANALLITPDVLECICYLRDSGGFPFHEELAFADGKRFQNIVVPNSDHNAMIMAAKDDFIARVRAL